MCCYMVTTERLGKSMSDIKNSKVFSPSQQAEAIEKLRSLIPGSITDGEIDIKAIADFTGLPLSGGTNTSAAFGLVWPGKEECNLALSPSAATLAPDLNESINFDTAENVFIEGDNLEVLKIVEHAYDDKVRLIYIDPPYNTGNDFVYNDDFSDDKKRYLQITGQIDADGNKLLSNPDTSGRKHANWLNMMHPRLVKAKNLLTQDGAIFVSIDDNEVHHLRMLMDSIFGPENFLGQFVWAAGRKNDAKFVSTSHEYMVCYSRNYNTLQTSVSEWRARKSGLDEIYKTFADLRKTHGDDNAAVQKGLREWFSNLSEGAPAKNHKHYKFVDDRGIYFPDNASAPDKPETRSHRPLIHPLTGKPTSVPTKGWRWNDETLDRLNAEGKIHFGVDESTVPQYKGYLADREFEAPYSVFYKDGRGATKRLRDFLGGEYFDYPKDETVIQSIVEFATDKDSIIMDFFGGSGTTGHAVALQNEKDGGRRKYVFVTLDEPTAKDSPAQKAGIESVSDIALMRLKKVTEEFPIARDQGLRVFRLSKSAFRPYFAEDGIPYDEAVSTLEANVTDHHVVTQIGLLNGLCLDVKWQWLTLGETQAVMIDGNLIILAKAMTEAILREVMKVEFKNAYFIEDSFAGKDALKKMAIYELGQNNKGFEAY
jgi:adenine-specific DNA-methyltransferase